MVPNERRGNGRGRGRGRARGHRPTNNNDRDYVGNRSNSRGYGSRYRGRGGRSQSRGRYNNPNVHWNSNGRYSTNRMDDVPEDLRQVIEEMGRTIATLTERLETIKNNRTSTIDGAPRPTTATTTSCNDDFATMCKSLYRWVQISHHQTNWERLPKSIDERLNKLSEDIRPPLANDEFRSAITRLTEQFGKKLRDLVSEHLTAKKIETEVIIGRLDRTDVDRAKDVASNYLNNHLGRRLTASRRTDLLDRAAAMVGLNCKRTSPPQQRNNNTPPTTPPRNTQADRQPPASTRKRHATGTPQQEPTTMEQSTSDDVNGDERVAPPIPPRQTTAKKLRPSPEHMLTDSGVNLFVGAKDNWTIDVEETTTCVVIGDSNLRGVSRIPPNWEIHSLAGAHINHVTGAIRRLKAHDSQKVDVIVQAGINHRDNVDRTVEQQIRLLVTEAHQNENIWRIFFAGVPTPAGLSDEETDNIRNLNILFAQNADDDKFITPIAPKDVETNATDHYGIHHTTKTADRIVDRMYKRLTGQLVF
jgi:hypothetical protein